jgi:hypothetical protein
MAWRFKRNAKPFLLSAMQVFSTWFALATHLRRVRGSDAIPGIRRTATAY